MAQQKGERDDLVRTQIEQISPRTRQIGDGLNSASILAQRAPSGAGRNNNPLFGILTNIVRRLEVILAHGRAHAPQNNESPGFTIYYDDGSTVRASAGPTLLEISRVNKIAHLAVCGGNSRCSTCRVRVVNGATSLATPNEQERRLLDRIGAPEDVRLACQIRPSASLSVVRLLKPSTRCAELTVADEAGVMRDAAVLFVDIREFTRLTETKLAFDVVFILNTFFAAVTSAIEDAGGRVDKYIGDECMAVFELGGGLELSTRNAILATLEVDAALEGVNKLLGDELAEPLRLAMGLHTGPVVLGKIGSGASASSTAIGRVVNLASRLEAVAKSRDVQLVMSRYSAELGGIDIAALAGEDVDIRGLEKQFSVVLVPRVKSIAALLRKS
jgi:adenylate cyclase